jgi:hypothetical protein
MWVTTKLKSWEKFNKRKLRRELTIKITRSKAQQTSAWKWLTSQRCSNSSKLWFSTLTTDRICNKESTEIMDQDNSTTKMVKTDHNITNNLNPTLTWDHQCNNSLFPRINSHLKWQCSSKWEDHMVQFMLNRSNRFLHKSLNTIKRVPCFSKQLFLPMQISKTKLESSSMSMLRKLSAMKLLPRSQEC